MATPASIAAGIASLEGDVAAHLATELGLAVGSEIFTGPVRKVSDDQSVGGAVPDEAIFVLATGGFADIPVVDGGALGREARPTVQIWIRSVPRDYDGGRALAASTFVAIDKNPPAGYFESRAADSAPAYIRRDDEDHHEWSINVTLKRWEP